MCFLFNVYYSCNILYNIHWNWRKQFFNSSFFLNLKFYKIIITFVKNNNIEHHSDSCRNPRRSVQWLEDMRQRVVQLLSDGTNERRDHLLEEQRRRDARLRSALEQNQLPTYERAVNFDVTYQNLRSFNVSCIHYRAVHFFEERLSNRIDGNSFGNCCFMADMYT